MKTSLPEGLGLGWGCAQTTRLPCPEVTLTRAVLGQVLVLALLLLPEGAAAGGLGRGRLGRTRRPPVDGGGGQRVGAQRGLGVK